MSKNSFEGISDMGVDNLGKRWIVVSKQWGRSGRTLDLRRADKGSNWAEKVISK